jgi:hypothetical protein
MPYKVAVEYSAKFATTIYKFDRSNCRNSAHKPATSSAVSSSPFFSLPNLETDLLV